MPRHKNTMQRQCSKVSKTRHTHHETHSPFYNSPSSSCKLLAKQTLFRAISCPPCTLTRHLPCKLKLDKTPCKASKETKNIFMQRKLARSTFTAKHTQSLTFTLLTQWHTLHSHARNTKERKRKLKQR